MQRGKFVAWSLFREILKLEIDVKGEVRLAGGQDREKIRIFKGVNI